MTDVSVSNLAGPESIEELLATLASTDLERFRRFFRNILENAPEQVISVAMRHLAASEIGKAERFMIVLLSNRDDYPAAIFDSENLDLDQAGKVAKIMFQSDSRFLAKLSSSMEDCEAGDPRSLVRALDLLNVIPDPSVLVKCLRNLVGHTDERVRSKAVMWLCRLRPNPALIQKQLQSADPRLRASVIEAVWHIHTPEMQSIFRGSLTDSHHRVAANALLGLHYCGDESVFETGAQLAQHSSPLFRAAAAWALGQMGCARTVPILESLAKDSDARVHRNAKRSLAILAAQGIPSSS